MRQHLSADNLLQSFAHGQRLKTRVDSDGTFIIPGKFGHLYQHDEQSLAVLVMSSHQRTRYWSAIRRKFATLGFKLTQDGDREGAALFAPGNPEQARAAIKAAGIKRKRQLSPSQINRQISWLRAPAGRAL